MFLPLSILGHCCPEPNANRSEGARNGSICNGWFVRGSLRTISAFGCAWTEVRSVTARLLMGLDIV